MPMVIAVTGDVDAFGFPDPNQPDLPVPGEVLFQLEPVIGRPVVKGEKESRLGPADACVGPVPVRGLHAGGVEVHRSVMPYSWPTARELVRRGRMA